MKFTGSKMYFRELFVLIFLIQLIIFAGCGGGGGGGGNDGVEASDDQFPFSNLTSPINSGSFLYGFINDDGYYYNFYGVRDNRNVPQYINKLVLTKKVDSDRTSLFLQILFDEHQRPIKITQPDRSGAIEINYIDDNTAEVTITGLDGIQETYTLAHPFQLPTQQSVQAVTYRGLLSETICDTIKIGYLDKSIVVSGFVYACDDGNEPYVEIVGGTPQKNFAPDLKQYSHNRSGEWSYAFNIDAGIPVDFEEWQDFCACNFVTNIALTISGGNEIVDLLKSAGEGLYTLFKDIQNESVTGTIKNTITSIVGEWKNGGTAETMSQLADFYASDWTLPCTEDRYELELNAAIANDYEVYCDYKGNTQKTVFDPLSEDAPDFNWTGSCDDRQEICNDQIDNDLDGDLDCADTDCVNDPSCAGCNDVDMDLYYAGSGCPDATDCDDSESSINPGAAEVCTDEIDNDCDGDIDCNDGDCDNFDACQRRWVLVDSQVNPNNELLSFQGGPDGTGWWYSDPRYEGKFLLYSVSETGFSMHDRHVDRGEEYYNVILSTEFDRPPVALIPGETVTMQAECSHSGAFNCCNPGPGLRFWYSGEGVAVVPSEPLPSNTFAYFPYEDIFTGASIIEYSFKVPATRDGSIKIWASWWNAPPVAAFWEYQAE